jgi:hypothetical protein
MASVHKGPVGPLRHRCHQCQATGLKLLRCGGCRAVRYCSREHQVTHRPQHKSTCSKIKKARAKLAEEEHRLRTDPPEFEAFANIFETQVGHFWSIASTRNYMRARFALAGSNLNLVGTLDGVHEALEHLQDMLRLSRGDNMSVRSLIPALMLRLDLDQECYDFVKWWQTRGQDSDYDWDDMTLPYLNLRGADVLEEPNFFGTFMALNHVVAILMLKLKLLVDIRCIKITRKVTSPPRLPFELGQLIEPHVIRSPLSANFLNKSPEVLSEIETKLVSQARQLGATLTKINKNFIFNLFGPEEALSALPNAYSPGSWEEMALAIHYSYAAWWETEGVLDILYDARRCAARDSEDEIGDMMESSTFRDGGGSNRTAEELLADVSLNRIWGYLDYAVENATYLGPWFDRPSERHTREMRESMTEDSESGASLSSEAESSCGEL